MQIMLISTDRNILKPGTAVAERMTRLAQQVDALFIIVFTNKKSGFNQPVRLKENLLVYATNSTSRWFYIFDAYKIAKKIVVDNSSKIIVSTQDPFETGLVGLFLHWFKGSLLHVQIHTDLYNPNFSKTILNRIRIFLAAIVLPRAFAIRVVSERIRQSLLKHGFKSSIISVLPVYVDKQKWLKLGEGKQNVENGKRSDVKRNDAERIRKILIVSRLESSKGLNEAVSAYIQLLNEIKKGGAKEGVGDTLKISLEIVGSGSLLAQLKKMAQPYPLIHFTPWTNDVSQFYANADALLVTSNYEGYGLTLVEAALSGVPIVSTDVGIINDVFRQDKEALVCTADVDNKSDFIHCLVTQLKNILLNPEMAKKLSQAAYQRALTHINYNEQSYWQAFVDNLNPDKFKK